MSKQTKTEGTIAEVLPTYADYNTRFSREEQERIEASIHESAWYRVAYQSSVYNKLKEGWPAEEREAVIKGALCPMCSNTRWVTEAQAADAFIGKEPIKVPRKLRKPCLCQKWQYVWKLAKREVPPMYHYVNLDTLQPNAMSRLPKDAQAAELAFIRAHRSESFLFLGPSGVGKTTMSMALLRDAFERNTPHFWSPTLLGLDFRSTRWIWRVDFNALVQQHTDKQKSDFGDEFVEPDVTVAKIQAAYDAGHQPVVVIEEVDKVNMTHHRLTILFNLIDRLISTGGQLVMTTNLTLPGLYQRFTADDELRVAGEPLLRRLLQGVNVRNLFEHCPAD